MSRKNPRGGRNWEGFANDPYLSGVAMVETITGIQDAGAQAVAKVSPSLGYFQHELIQSSTIFSTNKSGTGL